MRLHGLPVRAALNHPPFGVVVRQGMWSAMILAVKGPGPLAWLFKVAFVFRRRIRCCET
jgi:hypothetical protein